METRTSAISALTPHRAHPHPGPLPPGGRGSEAPRAHSRLCGTVGAAALLLLAACGGGAGGDATTVNGNIPIAYVKRSLTLVTNPLNAAPYAPGGDLMIRATASPSAPEYNITAPYTQGVGDVADPSVSFDGKKIVFAMNCPPANSASCTGRWNLWEYDTSAGGITAGTFRQLTNSTAFDDVGPAYLPTGTGFVFSSNRQAGSMPTQFVYASVTHSYQALDEYERETVFNLHTMDANGTAASVRQISFNQSHDRNPVVLSSGSHAGSIMFSRWEHVADRNRFTIFTVNPDGTGMFVLYGAHADGNSYLHPREMDPAGPYANQIVSDLMPLDRTQSGGALVLIDAVNYSDQNTPINKSVPATGGQYQLTAQALNYGTGLSQYGRVTTPFPLWDGTNRILLAFAPCEVSNAGVTVSCATLSAAELAALSDSSRLKTVAAADPVQANVPPSYTLYTFDPAAQTWSLVAAPPPGFVYTNPVPLQARSEPSGKSTVNASTSTTATIAVQSVYDTDLLDRMGRSMLADADLPAACASTLIPLPANLPAACPNTSDPALVTMIPPIAPALATDPRACVADLAKLRDPASPAYRCTPVRFIRIVRAVAPPSNMTGVRQAIGDTNFEQNQILGYAPVEPDGSFQITIPADTPVAFSVLDAKGRAIQVHTNWIQARPGETRTCDGCHSPRQGAAINTVPVTSSPAAGWNTAAGSVGASFLPGDTMASTHVRFDPSVLARQPDIDIVYPADVWAANPAQARTPIQIRYTGNLNPADDLVTTGANPEVVPLEGIINYPQHIQPIWERSRGANGVYTCTTCHMPPDVLDLTRTTAGSGRFVSYESLMVGAPLLDASGNPVIAIRDGLPVVVTGPALVNSMASESQVVGLARQSRLIEILAGQTLMSSAQARGIFPTPTGTVDHSTLLNAAEMRLVTEWIDLGGKYYNNPFDSMSNVLSVNALDLATYTAQVYPILMTTCAAGCHLAAGSGGTLAPGTNFTDNKFVLTGNPQGDFNNTITMITNTCNPADAANYLLSKPSTIPHPAGATGQTAAVLPAGGASYATIATWIRTGCP
jgi:hypothetical protein